MFIGFKLNELYLMQRKKIGDETGSFIKIKKIKIHV